MCTRCGQTEREDGEIILLPQLVGAFGPAKGNPRLGGRLDPSRPRIADLGIVIDGDFPSFDENAFKRELASLLRLEVSHRDIEIEPALGSSETVARVRTGSCEVRVKCIVEGGRAVELDADDRRIRAFVKEAIEEHWPSGVVASVAKPKVKYVG